MHPWCKLRIELTEKQSFYLVVCGFILVYPFAHANCKLLSAIRPGGWAFISNMTETKHAREWVFSFALDFLSLFRAKDSVPYIDD